MNAIVWQTIASATFNMTRFVANRFDAVRRIYEYFGWSLSHEAERRMRVLVASQAKRQSANHRYDLSQFGSSAGEVLSVFETYCKRFGLAHPSSVQQKQAARSVA